MDWYEMRVGFARDPKIKALRVRLKEPLADAYVQRIYAYCYEHEQDAFEAELGVHVLEDAAEWRGKTGALFTALIACGFVDRQGEALVVHGVGKRLGAAVKRRADAIGRREKWEVRTRSDRDRGAIGSRADLGTQPDQTRPDQIPMIDPDRQDHDRDLMAQPSQRLAGALSDFRKQLALRLGVPALGIGTSPKQGLDEAGVVEFFSQQLAAVGQETVLADCVEAARYSRNGTPSSLGWFPGWLKRLPVPQSTAGGVQ